MADLATFDSTANVQYNRGDALTIQNLSLTHDNGRLLFSNATFSIKHGVVTGLVGVNGAGKSSLALLLASRQLPNFPTNLSISYLSASMLEEPSVMACKPVEYIQSKVQERIQALQTEIEKLEQMLEQEHDAQELEEISEQLSLLYDMEESLNEQVQREMQHAIKSLGFSEHLEKPIAALSSGWRYKCRLISALLVHADLLIIDEPSFLDGPSMDWFVQQIQMLAHNKNAMALLISHKEALLETLCDGILYINAGNQTLTQYGCRYSVFRATHESQIQQAKGVISDTQDKLHHADKSLKHVQSQLRKREASLKAKTTQNADQRFIKGKNKEAKQKADKSAAAKLKQLEKTSHESLELKRKQAQRERVKPLHIDGMPSDRTVICCLYQVGLCYEPGEWIFQNVDVSMEATDRILLMGPNGCGKSSLVKLLVGQLEPTEGTVVSHVSNFMNFPQTVLADLLLEHGSESAKSFLHQGWTETHTRQHLGNYGLNKDLALRPIATLSAGQLVRLWLAKQAVVHPTPSLLIMDEISENVDVETRTSLVEMVDTYQGAVLTISHDEDFCQSFRYTQIWTLGPNGIRVKHNE